MFIMRRVVQRIFTFTIVVLLLHLLIIEVSLVTKTKHQHSSTLKEDLSRLTSLISDRAVKLTVKQVDIQPVQKPQINSPPNEQLDSSQTTTQQIVEDAGKKLPEMATLAAPYVQTHASSEYVNLLNVPAPDYLSNYKNPCWVEPMGASDGTFEGHKAWEPRILKTLSNKTKQLQDYYAQRLKNNITWKIRCLPYFYVAGVTKCGTSDLFALINKHPLITAAFKEIHWWSIKRTSGEKGYVPIKQYIDLMDSVVPDVEKETISINGTDGEFHPVIIGEGSPSTFWRNAFWTTIPEAKDDKGPRTHVAQYMQYITPQAKIILIFRDPSSRAYSQFHYAGGSTPQQYQECIKSKIKAMNDCLQQHTEWYCVNYNIGDCHFVNLAIGMYAVFMEKWLEAFPREQLYVIRLEDYAKNRTHTVNGIFKFLEVGSLPDKVLKEWEIQRVKNAHGTVEPMLNETSSLLKDFYRPYNERLATILNDDRFKWNK